MPERKTVGQLMEEMRLKAGAHNYHGHEYTDLERFAEDTRHMIIQNPRMAFSPTRNTLRPVAHSGNELLTIRQSRPIMWVILFIWMTVPIRSQSYGMTRCSCCPPA